MNFAMTTDQGTACPETCLCEAHSDKRKEYENTFCAHLGYGDPPVAGSWTDCDENEDCICQECG